MVLKMVFIHEIWMLILNVDIMKRLIMLCIIRTLKGLEHIQESVQLRS